MATTIGKLNFQVAADSSGVASGLKPGENAIGRLKSLVSGFTGGAGGGMSAMLAGLAGGAAVAGATAAISAVQQLGTAIVNAGLHSLKSAAEIQQLGTSFEVMTGSAAKGQSLLQGFRDMASVTPFDTAGLARAGETLLAYGVNADSVIPTVAMLGDVARGNAVKLQSISLAFGQIQAAGKLTGQDLLQLVAVGFNPLKEIADATGMSYAELRKKMEEGSISAEMVADAFKLATMEGGKFFGMSEKTSQDLGGKWSTLQDAITKLSGTFGEALAPTATRALDACIYLVEKLTLAVEYLAPSIEAAADLFFDLTSAAAKFSPIGLLWQMFDDGEKPIKKVMNAVKGVAESADDVRARLKGMADGSTDGALEGLRAGLESIKQESKAIEDRYAKMMGDVESRRGQFAGPAARNTVAGFEAVARAGQEGQIQRELVKLRTDLVAELHKIQEREREQTQAIKAKETIKVTEARI